MDTELEASVAPVSIKKCVRYVDDYRVFVKSRNFDCLLVEIARCFVKCGHGLRFTVQRPKKGKLPFLDVMLGMGPHRVCWSYRQRTSKPLLNWMTGHSAIIKDGIAVSFVRAAMTKSCRHTVFTSLTEKMARLRWAGYPDSCEPARQRPNG